MNTVGSLLTAYYNALNNNVPQFNIYKLSVPPEDGGNYVWLYPEGGADDPTKSSKVENLIIRVELCVVLKNDASQIILEAADETIRNIILPSAVNNGLTAPAGLQFLNVKRENYVYFIEQTTSVNFYKKISRYIHRVNQTA